MEKSITKIVITGGPCAGKTTAMSWIQNNFEKLGYCVMFVPETATELMTSGVKPCDCLSGLDYQKCQMKFQLKKEKIFEEAARVQKKDKILIVCDRGLMDNSAYMSSEELNIALDSIGFTDVQARDNYDAVFHLVTAANGATDFYTLSNNVARTETIEEAIALDNKLLRAWAGHPHLRVIDNSFEFDEKMRKLISEISNFLGEPEPFEIERKYLVEYPDIMYLESMPYSQKVNIIQTYLKCNSEGHEVRVRQRGYNGSYIFTQTEKIKVSDTKRVEIEKRISEPEYVTKLMDADTNLHAVRKNRYCFLYKNKYFELDLYAGCTTKAILEIELSSEKEEFELPNFLNIIKEVTNDEYYKNKSIAKRNEIF